MTTQTRQPAGVPIGGQFSTLARTEVDTVLDPVGGDVLHHPSGAGGVTCFTGEADGVPVFQIDTDGEMPRRVRVNLNDAVLYDGNPEVDDTPPASAGASLVGRVDFTGAAADIRARAQQAMWDAQTIYEIAGAKAAAEDILAEHPDAAVLELEENYDDDGASSWSGGRILDATGKHIADFDDFADEHWASITDLPVTPKHRVLAIDPSGSGIEIDPKYAFMAWEGSKQRGYTAKVDLRAAAGIDLVTVLDAS